MKVFNERVEYLFLKDLAEVFFLGGFFNPLGIDF
jgi:hypothetical protein